MARLLAAGLLVGVCACPAQAEAQVRDGLASSLSLSGGAFWLGDRALEEGLMAREPDALRGVPVRLGNRRAFLGGVLRETLILSNVRWSLAVGLLALPGKGATAAPADGLVAQGRVPLVASFELAVGRQLNAGPILPYADLRASFHLLSSRVELSSPQAGRLSVTDYEAYVFGLGPRVGFWLPLGSNTHLDLSARAGIWGPERFGVDLGLAFYLPWGPRRRGRS